MCVDHDGLRNAIDDIRELELDLRALVEQRDVYEAVWARRAFELAAVGADRLHAVEVRLREAIAEN